MRYIRVPKKGKKRISYLTSKLHTRNKSFNVDSLMNLHGVHQQRLPIRFHFSKASASPDGSGFDRTSLPVDTKLGLTKKAKGVDPSSLYLFCFQLNKLTTKNMGKKEYRSIRTCERFQHSSITECRFNRMLRHRNVRFVQESCLYCALQVLSRSQDL